MISASSATRASPSSRTGRYHIPPEAARTIAALLALRDQVIAPVPAGVRSPRRSHKVATWTRIDRDYETLRAGGITPQILSVIYP